MNLIAGARTHFSPYGNPIRHFSHGQQKGVRGEEGGLTSEKGECGDSFLSPLKYECPLNLVETFLMTLFGINSGQI